MSKVGEYINGKWYHFVKGLMTIASSDISLPVDLQDRYSKTEQTHNAVSVAASANTTVVEVPTKGYQKGLVVAKATGIFNLRVSVVMTNGTTIFLRLVTSDNNTDHLKAFDLNGVEKISVFGTDTSAAANAITIEVYLQA